MDSKKQRLTATVPALVLAAVTGGTGCSLLLDWDPNNQPCDAGKCLDGYSCLVDKCVADGSLAIGENCVSDNQCNASICTGSSTVAYACRATCTTYFQKAGNCSTSSYCRPSPDPAAASAAGAARGSCVQSECGSDADCQVGSKVGSVCVSIDTGVGACLFPCKDPSGTSGIPSCTGVTNIWASGSTQYCQPLGKSGALRLVCLQQSPSPQAASQTCSDTVSSPTCNGLSGLLCVANQCKLYCNATTKSPCSNPSNCTALTTADVPQRTFGYCQSP